MNAEQQQQQQQQHDATPTDSPQAIVDTLSPQPDPVIPEDKA